MIFANKTQLEKQGFFKDPDYKDKEVFVYDNPQIDLVFTYHEAKNFIKDANHYRFEITNRETNELIFCLDQFFGG